MLWSDCHAVGKPGFCHVQIIIMCKLLSCANYYHVQIIIMCKVILHLTEDAC